MSPFAILAIVLMVAFGGMYVYACREHSKDRNQ